MMHRQIGTKSGSTKQVAAAYRKATYGTAVPLVRNPPIANKK